MAKKGADCFQSKMTRNDRFAQMSHQEKIIEQKKKEIMAKLEAKKNATSNQEVSKGGSSNKSQGKTETAKSSTVNIFSNDGSFLNTFRNMKDKRLDSKLKSFKTKDNTEKSDERSNKSRWPQRRRSPSPKDRPKARVSRFDKISNFEPKITINTSFSSSAGHPSFDYDLQQQQSQSISITPQNVTGQPLMTFPSNAQSNVQVIVSQPLLLNVPPPQLGQGQMVISTHPGNVLVSATSNQNLQPPNVINTVTLPPNSTIISNQISIEPQTVVSQCVATVELTNIPPPNPIQVQNIPPPEPINAMNIPQPAPLQVQNIPTPATIQLNEIPNPKPIDLMAIPTPSDETISDPGFLKNIPPPNKSVPPPTIPEPNISVPPPPPPNCVSLLSTTPAPTVPMQTQNILVHTVSQVPQQIQTIQAPVPPPTPFAPVMSVSVPLATATSGIPSLMAQPILPPPGMGVGAPQPVNVNCPPPMIPPPNTTNVQIQNTVMHMQSPPPSFVNQPPPITSQMPPITSQMPPITSQMPPMNVPPPTNIGPSLSNNFIDMNAVFPPGTPDYEAMASLGRMVAQCGPGIEDVVRQRKDQEPSLWFLFHKESAAYRQYLELVEHFKAEMEISRKCDDIYEPEKADEDIKTDLKQELFDPCEGGLNSNRRKRKSRWGDKEVGMPAPTVAVPTLNPSALALPLQVAPINAQVTGQVMLSKVTRNDPALLQYAMKTFGSANLTEDEWKKAEDHYKINLLYQDMLKKRDEVNRLKAAGKNKYDYDSDEETDGGTWEHKLREKEMLATEMWATELNRQAEGKHHIGDFLPPEEYQRFIEKTNAAKEGRQLNFSDYKEFKIKEDNIGFKMLQKLGWTEGEGLGSSGSGIVEPVNKGAARDMKQGLGLNSEDGNEDDEYEAYRKRMMLAYRFRPNPLNNPRRPYY